MVPVGGEGGGGGEREEGVMEEEKGETEKNYAEVVMEEAWKS